MNKEFDIKLKEREKSFISEYFFYNYHLRLFVIAIILLINLKKV